MTGRRARREAPLDVPTAPVIAVSRQEAAWACGVELRTIAAAIFFGHLPAKRTGREQAPGWGLAGQGTGRYLIGLRDLEAWLEDLDPDAPFLAAKCP